MAMTLLKIYITGKTPRIERAIAGLRGVLDENLGGEYEMHVYDVLEDPELAEKEKILATPTLVKELPLPAKRVIGDLSDPQKVLFGLDLGDKVPEGGRE